VTVNNTDCINNRLLKLLQYLDAKYPSENWGQLMLSNSIEWSKIIAAGHSQGGVHATALGINNELKRIIMFCSANDYSNNSNGRAN